MKNDLFLEEVDVLKSNFENEDLSNFLFYNKSFGTIQFDNCSFENSRATF